MTPLVPRSKLKTLLHAIWIEIMHQVKENWGSAYHGEDVRILP